MFGTYINLEIDEFRELEPIYILPIGVGNAIDELISKFRDHESKKFGKLE